MKVKLVSVEEGITALGFRRIAAIARKLNPNAEIYFLTTGNLYNWRTQIFPANRPGIGNKDLDVIARKFADADLLCFSSMTPGASYVIKIAEAVKQKNSEIFILWGGTHCILLPDEAIRYVDAICTGEGETPFEVFYKAFAAGNTYLNTPGMWFNAENGIIKNRNSKLNNSEDLSLFPHLFYDLSCQIYDLKLKEFRNFTEYDYVEYNGLCYRTVWTIGCPFSCTYCANNAFINIDKDYSRIRYPSVDYIIKEIEYAIRIYPFISAIAFYDDNFIGISRDVLEMFCNQYKKRVNLPFVVFGMHPNLVTKEKVELLGEAGMSRARMGIQSGSEKILSFFNRTTSLDDIEKSTKILAEAAKKYKMLPPAYDIISDNPLETREDIVETLKFLYELERPYTLTIFSLRVFPRTKLWEYFENHPVNSLRHCETSYLETKKTITNILLYILGIGKPPKIIFSWLLRYIHGGQEKQRSYPALYLIVKCAYLLSRAIAHLRKSDFTTIVGFWGYFLFRAGLIKVRFRKASYKSC